MSRVDLDASREGDESKKVTLIAIVGGDPVKVKANADEPLESIIPDALEKAGTTGRPPEDWLIKDKEGNLYDRHKLIREYHFPTEFAVYLSLGTGEAG